MTNVIGLDCSHWQDNNSTPITFDFHKAKAAGAQFAIMKASQSVWSDEDYRINNANARAAGMIRGAYHFLVWEADPVAQADYFWSVIKADPGELPPVADFEWWKTTPGNALDILSRFLARLEQLCGRVPMIYTSAGFWNPYGSRDAKWARYPLWVAHYTTGAPIIPLPWTDYAIHQYTSKGDGKLYGAESAGIDLNRTSAAKLAALTGTIVTPEPKPEEPTMSYKNLPLGYITSNTTDAGWSNTGFAFFVGMAGNGDSDPNPNLKPIEVKAAELQKPFLALWDFHPQYYVSQQYGPDDAHWPPLAQDAPVNACINAIRNRDCKALIVRVMDNVNKLDGKPIDKLWMSYSAQVFCGRVSDWLKANKPGCRLILATSYPFIAANAPGISNWSDKYAWATTEQPALLDSYPIDTAKPGYLANNRWDLWLFHARLALAWRDTASLYSWLGFTSGTTPEEPTDPEPEPQTDVLKALALLSDKLDRVAAQVEALTAANANNHDEITGGLADLTADFDRVFK